MSWWLTTSASAGASFSVAMKNCVAFMGSCVGSLGPQQALHRQLHRMRETEGSRAAPGRCNNEISQ
jgi:hypothetical protein